MRYSTIYEKIHETRQGYKYIVLSSGRKVMFSDVKRQAETSLSNLWRYMSRMGKLARKYHLGGEEYDFDWEDIEHLVNQLETLVQVWRTELEKHGVKQNKERLIKQLRNVKGRNPQEAAAYLAKAEELEREG